MNHFARASGILLVLIGLGCKSKPPAPVVQPPHLRPLALVNVIDVEDAMGWKDDIAASTAREQQDASRQLESRLADLQQQLNQTRADVAKAAHFTTEQIGRLQALRDPRYLSTFPLSPGQQMQIQSAMLQCATETAEARNESRQQLEARHANLIESYRSKVMQVAKQVADAAGFRIVIVLTENIVYHDPSTDVTRRVIDELNRSKPSWEQGK